MVSSKKIILEVLYLSPYYSIYLVFAPDGVEPPPLPVKHSNSDLSSISSFRTSGSSIVSIASTCDNSTYTMVQLRNTPVEQTGLIFGRDLSPNKKPPPTPPPKPSRNSKLHQQSPLRESNKTNNDESDKADETLAQIHEQILVLSENLQLDEHSNK